MKIGSLVECINAVGDFPPMKPLEMGRIYTVRDIGDHLTVFGDVGVILEELINPIHFSGLEWCYAVARFREVQPPMDLSWIEELQFEMVS